MFWFESLFYYDCITLSSKINRVFNSSKAGSNFFEIAMKLVNSNIFWKTESKATTIKEATKQLLQIKFLKTVTKNNFENVK